MMMTIVVKGLGLGLVDLLVAVAERSVRKRVVDYGCYWSLSLRLSRTSLFAAVAAPPPPQRYVGGSNVAWWDSRAVPVFRLAHRQMSFSRIDYYWC
jgi:hypothetical protein